MKKMSNRQRRYAATQHRAASRRHVGNKPKGQPRKTISALTDYAPGYEVQLLPEHPTKSGYQVEHEGPFVGGSAGLGRSEFGDPAPAGRLRAAIAQYCLDCCGGSSDEVSQCSATRCPVWSYRFDLGPSAMGDAAATAKRSVPDFPTHGALAAVRLRCLDCSGGEPVLVRDCAATTCGLRAHRLDRCTASATSALPAPSNRPSSTRYDLASASAHAS
jgi:hypothetical protein